MKTISHDVLTFDLSGDMQLAVAVAFFGALALATLAKRLF